MEASSLCCLQSALISMLAKDADECLLNPTAEDHLVRAVRNAWPSAIGW